MITKTDGKTRIGRKPIPERLTVYDKATGEAHEKWPIDANECVAGGNYTFEKPEVTEPTTEAADQAPEPTTEVKEAPPAVKPDLSTKTKAELLDLARSQRLNVKNSLSKAALLALITKSGG